MTEMSANIIRYAFAWFVLAAGWASIVGSINLPTLRNIISNERVGEAVIDKITCEDHNSVTFYFKSDGVTYTGKNTPRYPTPDCRKMRPGERVTVYYSAVSPNSNTLNEPNAAFRDELQSVLILSAIFPLFMIIAWNKMIASKNKKQAGG